MHLAFVHTIIQRGGRTQVCLYMSVLLLVLSIVYYTTGFAYAYVLGTIGLAYFSFNEGEETTEKVSNPEMICGCH